MILSEKGMRLIKMYCKHMKYIYGANSFSLIDIAMASI